MLPALALLVGFGRRRRLWLPLPTILLWPFWLLGWTAWAVLWLLRVPQAAQLRLFLESSARLSGLRLHIETQDGLHIHVHLV